MRSSRSFSFLALVALVVVGAQVLAGCQDGERSAAEPRSVEGAEPAAGAGPAPRGGPSLTLVRNEDGGTQVREASQTVLVIHGTELADATSVVVGATGFSQILSATATELRVSCSCFGMARGPAAVTVTTPGGAASLPDAVEITPFVVSPSAPMGGRGTFDSPMHLCDPALPSWIGGGNLIHLLGGVHVCAGSLLLFGRVDIEGAADGSTVIRGDGTTGFAFFLVDGGQPGSPAQIRRLTFEAPLDAVSLSLNNGSFQLEDIAGGRISAISAGSISLDGYSFDGAGPGLDLDAAHFALSDLDVRCAGGDGASGIRLASQASRGGARSTVERVAVTHCSRGVLIDRVSPFFQVPEMDLEDLELVDNEIGLEMRAGIITVRELEIRGDAATPLVSQYGVKFSGHYLDLLGGTIRDQTMAGIEQYTSTPGGQLPDPVAQLFVDQLEIVGGPLGISFLGYDGGTDLKVRRSVLRDQTVACVQGDGYESWIDLGTVDDPGGNALSVVSGYAVDDLRTDTRLGFYFYIDAHGTTLNGLGYDGHVIDGPAYITPDFRIPTWNSGIRF